MGTVSLTFWGLSQPFAASATAEGLHLGTPTWGSMRQVLLKSQVQLHSHSQEPDPRLLELPSQGLACSGVEAAELIWRDLVWLASPKAQG